jgi:hypothetical protein
MNFSRACGTMGLTRSQTPKNSPLVSKKRLSWQTVFEQCAGLLPIAEHHHEERACFRSRPRDSHTVLEVVREVVLKEPIASLSQLGFAAHLVDLQVELRLFVRVAYRVRAASARLRTLSLICVQPFPTPARWSS